MTGEKDDHVLNRSACWKIIINQNESVQSVHLLAVKVDNFERKMVWPTSFKVKTSGLRRTCSLGPPVGHKFHRIKRQGGCGVLSNNKIHHRCYNPSVKKKTAMKIFALLSLALVLLSTSPANAQDDEVHYNAELEIFSSSSLLSSSQYSLCPNLCVQPKNKNKKSNILS